MNYSSIKVPDQVGFERDIRKHRIELAKEYLAKHNIDLNEQLTPEEIEEQKDMLYPGFICMGLAMFVGEEDPDYNMPTYERVERHEIILLSPDVAVSTYECCFAMWYLHNGSIGGGSLWKKDEWMLTPATLKHLRSIRPSK